MYECVVRVLGRGEGVLGEGVPDFVAVVVVPVPGRALASFQFRVWRHHGLSLGRPRSLAAGVEVTRFLYS